LEFHARSYHPRFAAPRESSRRSEDDWARRERERERERERDRERARDREGDRVRSTSSSSGDHSGPARERSRTWEDDHILQGRPHITARERAAVTPVEPWYWGWHGIALVFAGVLGLTFVPSLVRGRSRAWWRRVRPARVAPAEGTAWIERVSIAFDWTAREAIQRDLSALARTLSTSTPIERGDSARAVLGLAIEHASAARYAFSSAQSVAMRDASGELRRGADELRARFRREVEGRGAGAPARDTAPRSDEGNGLVVVSVLFGSVDRIAGARSATRETVASQLERLRDAIKELAGVEVVWSPADPDDRLSSYELERLYPEMTRLDEGVGSIECAHCGAPYPRELGACPKCGAPPAES
jgi:hypothetical protein